MWEKVLVQAVGPLVTAVVGTLIIGTFVAWITRRAQERRADSQAKEEKLRAENQIRLQLISQMTEAASGLYITTQSYWRKKDIEKAGSEELAQHRKELDQQYRATRIVGEVIERRLEVYFSSSESKMLWHATMDLLTVRYFHLIGLTTENLLERNAGGEHTGLTVEQLRDQSLILKTYREKLLMGTRAVLQGPVRPLAG